MRFLILLAAVLGLAFTAIPLCRAEGEIPAELKNVCIYHPEPDWWAQARAGEHGRVTCQLKIDPSNGEVTEVKLLKKTRFQRLNSACVLACFKWRFKPHTVTQVTVPFQLEVRGYFKEIH